MIDFDIRKLAENKSIMFISLIEGKYIYSSMKKFPITLRKFEILTADFGNVKKNSLL